VPGWSRLDFDFHWTGFNAGLKVVQAGSSFGCPPRSA
jgi:hypothetical protein